MILWWSPPDPGRGSEFIATFQNQNIRGPPQPAGSLSFGCAVCGGLGEGSYVRGRLSRASRVTNWELSVIYLHRRVFREWGLGHEMHQLRPRGFYVSSR